MSDNPSLTITPARASFFVALATLAGLAWSSTTYLADQNYRLIAVEEYIAEQKTTNKELLAELKSLTVSMARLSTVIETMTRQTSASTEIRFEPPGVVEAWGGNTLHRAAPTTRDSGNYENFGANE